MVYVIVDEPNAEDEAHSSYAQGIAQEIFAETLPYLNIYPDEPMAAAMPVNPTLPEAKQQAIEAANAAASGQQADAAVPDQTQAEEGTTDTPSSDIAEQGAATTGPAVTNDVDVVTSE